MCNPPGGPAAKVSPACRQALRWAGTGGIAAVSVQFERAHPLFEVCRHLGQRPGGRHPLFDPKVDVAGGAARAKRLLGSANLTRGGLRTNIEASVLQTLDLANRDDAEFLADLEGKLDAMIADYPENVIRATDDDQLAALLRSGRLLDEQQTCEQLSAKARDWQRSGGWERVAQDFEGFLT